MSSKSIEFQLLIISEESQQTWSEHWADDRAASYAFQETNVPEQSAIGQNSER